jgi:glycosyltransferase involved in cell wall biosynthesis
MKLSILMPCLNEAETLEICIKKANQWVSRTKIDCEIIIADNGSNDGSQAIAIANGARVVSVTQKGYGSALYHGVKAAQGEFVIMGDSDDSYDFSQLDGFINKLEAGCDLVMGNRFLGGINKGAMPWKNRYIGNPILTWIGRILFRCQAKDFHCGLRGFSKSAFNKMDLRTTGMEFASEMVIKASLFGMRVAEVPTILSKDGRSRPPHLRPWRDGWRHLRFMLLFSPKWLFLFPGFFILSISTLAYILLVLGPVQIYSINFDIHTLFYAQAGMIIGYLTIAFGMIIRLFGMREGLLQNNVWLRNLNSYPLLELGGMIGICLTAIGILIGSYALNSWRLLEFGNLNDHTVLRIVSISTTFIIFGAITILISLIMGFLALPTREDRFD